MAVLDPDLAVGENFWRRVFEAQEIGQGPKRTDFPCKHEFVSWEYLHHNDGTWSGGGLANGAEILPTGAVRVRQKPNFEKGLSTTRFCPGFQRRRQSHIRQDEARLDKESRQQRSSMLHLEKRRQRLGSLDTRNDFNLITGQFNPANRRCTTPFHVQPKTRESGLLSEVAERAEYVLLRDSEYKFHAPAWSGKNHDARQDLLQREGLTKPKKSTLLGIGGADLASAGAEDMFSKAIYDPAKACAVEGLVEKSIPGLYTPRKVAARTAPAERSNAATKLSASGRPLSSAAALGTVFRVVPTGLGNPNGAPAGRGREGGSVPGIAPRKRLVGSSSAPTLGWEFKAKTMESPPDPAESGASIRSPPCSGEVTHRATGSAAVGHLLQPDKLRQVVRTSAGKAFAVEGGNGGYTDSVGDEGNRSRGLSRSRSDLDKSGCSGSGRGSGPSAADFLRKSASAGPLGRSPGDGSTDISERRGSSTPSRGASPAERRSADQLALDFAAVRSLDAR